MGLSLSVLTLSASAATITINSWDTLPASGWHISSHNPPTIDSSTDTPDRPNALRFTYPIRTKDDGFSAGRANYKLPNEQEIWYGHWFKFSPNFQWHTVANKINYVWNGNDPNNGNWFVAVAGNRTLEMQNQIKWAPFQSFFSNTGFNPTIQAGRWYWVEVHAKQNTPGKYDGVFELSLDGQLVMRHTNVGYRSAAQTNLGFGVFQHAPIWGGHSGAHHTQVDYLWVDFTVISTSPIGMPPPGSDSSAPQPPQGLRISQF